VFQTLLLYDVSYTVHSVTVRQTDRQTDRQHYHANSEGLVW